VFYGLLQTKPTLFQAAFYFFIENVQQEEATKPQE
jgi:hypothetical protein